MMGRVELYNARFERDAELFGDALERAQRINAALRAARASRHLALACVWFDPDRALALIPEARELNSSLGETVGLGQCDTAMALAHALRDEWDESMTI